MLRRCLQREKAKRLGDIHDAQLEIEDVIAGTSSVTESGANAAGPRPKSARALCWLLGGAAAGAAVVLGLTLAGLVPTFPDRKRSWPVTTDGGRPFRWRDDGKALLVASLSGHVVAYPVNITGDNVTIGRPAVLIRNVGNAVLFSSASRDHSRIAIRVDAESAYDRGEIQLLFGALRR